MQEHPRHTLCLKPYAIPELVYSDERLTNPLRKISGKFKEITWDEAFDFISDKLGKIKQKYGAKAMVVHHGNPYVGTHAGKVAKHFCDLYGTPNYTTGDSFCFYADVIGKMLTCGNHTSPNYSENTRCMVVWGRNPPETYPLEADAIHALLGRSAKLIVIDPRATPLAKKADIYAQIRPGTDCALLESFPVYHRENHK